MIARDEEDALAVAVEALGGPSSAVVRLGRHLSEERRARIEAVLDARLASLTVALEAVHDPGNFAAIVRSAEAVGLQRIHAVGGDASRRGRKAARGASPWIEARCHDSLDDLVVELRRQGMRIAAACVDAAMTRPLAEVPVDRPLCVLVGSEQGGLSRAARAAADLCFRIPMHGMVESLNVSVAAAIALHELGERRRRHLGRAGDLAADERTRLRACWYARSVDPRLSAGLAARRRPADPA